MLGLYIVFQFISQAIGADVNYIEKVATYVSSKMNEEGIIDPSIVGSIESSFNTSARNGYANGVLQIGRPALKDYNRINETSINYEQLRNPKTSHAVSNWLLNDWIPKRVKAQGLKATRANVLMAYNVGAKGLKQRVDNKKPWGSAKSYATKYDNRINSNGPWYDRGLSQKQYDTGRYLQGMHNKYRVSKGLEANTYPEWKINPKKGLNPYHHMGMDNVPKKD